MTDQEMIEKIALLLDSNLHNPNKPESWRSGIYTKASRICQLFDPKPQLGKLVDGISDILRNYRIDISRNQADRAEIVAQHILSLIDQSYLDWAKENGYVKLSKDQSLPEHHLLAEMEAGIAKAIFEDELQTIKDAQEEMLNAGFRRIEL